MSYLLLNVTQVLPQQSEYFIIYVFQIVLGIEELKQYDNLKKELQQIYENKGEAAKFRSKCMWAEKGERPTKYFFNLEKRNYSRKVISELEDDEGKIRKEEEQILLKKENYYRDLYTSKMDVTEEQFNHYIEQLEVPCLSQEVSEKAEGRLTYA